MATASGAVALLVALGCALLVSGWAVQTNKSRCAPTSDAHERVPRVRRHQSGSAIVGAAASTATVLTADLRNSYGSNTLAGVSCDIHNQAVTAWAVLDSSLLPAQRTAMLAWADAALMSFAASSCEELILRGWRVERSGRWYLLAFDGSTWGSKAEHAATALLKGPIVPDHAERTYIQLREYTVALVPSQNRDGWVALSFALWAGSRDEAMMQALSLDDDLG